MAHYKTIKDTRLLPCPFCGSDAAIWYFSADEKLRAKEAYYVGCTNDECGCEIEQQGGFSSLEEAISAWNRRTPQEPKTGHWIYVGEENKEETKAGNFRYVCSECGFSDVHGKSICVPYCWQCGAKMEEVEE